MRKAIYWDGTQFLPVDENSTITLTGDITGTGYASFATALKTSGVAAGSYGSGSAIPVITVDSNGRITEASTSAVNIPTGLTAGSTLTGFVNYSGTTATTGQWDGSAATPMGTTRLNYGGYLYPTYLNLIGSADTETAATHYFMETGSDGFVRPKTLANVRTEIVTTAAVNAAAATTVGTITSGVWNGTAIPVTNGGTGATTAAAALTNLGLTATAAELNYTDGVTSNIQTQLNAKAASSHTHNYAASASAGGAAITISSPDGDRNSSTKLPTTSPNAVRFDFASSSSAGTGGTYAGVMTYAPWDGTSGSTGDASYQLAFGSTAANGGGVPMLNIRKGIDSTWNSWYTLLHSGGGTLTGPLVSTTNNFITSKLSGVQSWTFHHSGNSSFYIAPSTSVNGEDWDYSKAISINVAGDLFTSGNITATRVYGAVYNDYAEYFLKDEPLEPGDIIIKNPNGEGYIKSRHYKDKLVIGVYSDEYSHCIGGLGDGNDEENFASVGLAGRLRVKVIGKVEVGDFIVASYTPGVGVAADSYLPGTVVGKALEAYNSPEVGRIQILIMNI